MKKNIPNIEFLPSKEEHYDFEIVPIATIIKNKVNFVHNPEQPHQLKFYNLIFFTKGKGQHFIDFNWHPVKKNTLIYLTKEQVHAFEFSDSLHGYCIVFSEEYFLKSVSHLPDEFMFRLFNPQLFSPLLQMPPDSEFNKYFDLLLKEYNDAATFNKKTILNSLFVIMLSKAEGLRKENAAIISNSSKIGVFQKFTSLLQERFAETRSAEYYAAELDITYKHLNSICKVANNKTAKNVINDFIILQAKRNLINTDLSSTELSYKMGFEDPTNFSKFFKKNTGLSPNQFKKDLK